MPGASSRIPTAANQEVIETPCCNRSCAIVLMSARSGSYEHQQLVGQQAAAHGAVRVWRWGTVAAARLRGTRLSLLPAPCAAAGSRPGKGWVIARLLLQDSLDGRCGRVDPLNPVALRSLPDAPAQVRFPGTRLLLRQRGSPCSAGRCAACSVRRSGVRESRRCRARRRPCRFRLDVGTARGRRLGGDDATGERDHVQSWQRAPRRFCHVHFSHSLRRAGNP